MTRPSAERVEEIRKRAEAVVERKGAGAAYESVFTPTEVLDLLAEIDALRDELDAMNEAVSLDATAQPALLLAVAEATREACAEAARNGWTGYGVNTFNLVAIVERVTGRRA